MKTCESCKYWDKKANSIVGDCDKIDVVDIDAYPKEASAVVRLYADDDQGLNIAITTGKNFGCTLHEDK